MEGGEEKEKESENQIVTLAYALPRIELETFCFRAQCFICDTFQAALGLFCRLSPSGLQVKLDVTLGDLTKIGKSQKFTLSVDVEGGRLVLLRRQRDSQEDWTTFTHDRSEPVPWVVGGQEQGNLDLGAGWCDTPLLIAQSASSSSPSVSRTSWVSCLRRKRTGRSARTSSSSAPG